MRTRSGILVAFRGRQPVGTIVPGGFTAEWGGSHSALWLAEWQWDMLHGAIGGPNYSMDALAASSAFFMPSARVISPLTTEAR